MDKETKKFLETRFSNLENKIDGVEFSLSRRINEVESTLTNRIDNVELSLTNKINDLQITINRIDKRSDEDTRAIIKDVHKIKKSLKKHKILV